MDEQNLEKKLKYQQIKEYIIGLAMEQKWAPGHKLPSENDLVQQFSISRTTVRQAFADLEQEGIICRRRGQGTFFAGKGRGGDVRHFLIGVTVSLTTYIYPDIIQGAEKVLVQAGYHLVIGRSSLDLTLGKASGSGAAGWIPEGHLLELWNSVDGTDLKEVCRSLTERNMPYVLMNWVSEDPEVSCVAPDDVDAGKRAFRCLNDLGHVKIAYVGLANNQPSRNRLLGFRNAAEAEGRSLPESMIKECEEYADKGSEVPAHTATRELLGLGRERPTAIFCFNDEYASGVYQAIREAGLSIPDDVSVIGFDDSSIAQALYPALTSFTHPKERVGEMAARILLDRIENPDTFLPVHVLYSCRLRERGSVKKLH
jgi:GntR family transcriptional regulator, arabinose operon transcriptional repressor